MNLTARAKSSQSNTDDEVAVKNRSDVKIKGSKSTVGEVNVSNSLVSILLDISVDTVLGTLEDGARISITEGGSRRLDGS